MKICVVSSIFPPYARGGAEVVVEATARAFAESGHDVLMITCAPFEGWRSFAGKWETLNSHPERSEGSRTNVRASARDSSAFGLRMTKLLRVFRFTPLNLFTIFSISKYPPLLRLIWHGIDMLNPHTYLVVRRILREEKPDLIITRNLKGLGFTVPLAIRYCQKSEVRRQPPAQRASRPGGKTDTVLQFRPPSSVLRPPARWIHGLHDLNALHPRGFMEWGKESAIHNPNPLVRLYRAVARWLFGSPDAVIAPSQFVLDEYARAGFFPRSRKVVIPNPVFHNSPPPPQSSPIKGEEEKKNPPPLVGGARGGGQLCFLYLGQLEPYKGLRVLIDAWRQFASVHQGATLEIVGKGSMEEEIVRFARQIPGIVLRGFVSHENLDELYVNVRATILPSLAYETFGMSVAESLVHGVPVIASRIGALSEIVDDGVNGILVSPGDATSLKEAMEQALSKKFNFTASPFLSPSQYREELEKLYKT